MSEIMNPIDTELEKRLARLEAGEPLEACLAGLPEADAGLVRTAAALRAAPPSRPNPEHMARQRRAYLRAAAALRTPTRPKSTARQWAVPGLALAGMATLFMCVFVPLAFGALAWLRSSPGAVPVAQITPASTVTRPPTTATGAAPSATDVPPTTVAVAPPDAQAAVLHDARGLVQLQGPDGAWQVVADGQVIRAGQRLRTAALSGVTLVFNDGSQSRLGAGSELSIDELDAPTAGARVVALTQWLGESRHNVTPSADPGSRFLVNTPAGAGTAKGTVFQVRVTPALLVRFDVDEGAVDVTHADASVLVVAGQSTIVTAGQPPSAPAFLISGEGQVQAIGQTWQIAERSFLTHPNTIVFGEPQLGDWVSFEGRVIATGERVVDKIVLLRRAADDRFTLVGQVTAIGASEWVIAGRTLRVDSETQLDPGLAIGAWVEATGGISTDGAWWASRIRPLDEPAAGFAFRFTGTLQAQAEGLWTVSGIDVTLDAETQLDSGLVVGDIVRVEGHLLEDGTWLARTLQRVTPSEGAFEIAGELESLEPLLVDGLRLVTAAWTEMDEGLAVGDRVRVEGRILDDGTWLAERVQRLDDGSAPTFEFTGVLNTLDPWMVANLPLGVDTDTIIDEGLVAGDLVRVEGVVLDDGTWLAREIRRVDDDLGCLNQRGVISQIDGQRIILADGQVINLEGVTLAGPLSEAMVIEIYGCADVNGEFRPITIIILYQLEDVPATPTPTPAPNETPEAAPQQDHVTLCHRPPGNPSKAHTITVGAPAVPAHLDHGDTLGGCP